MRNDDSNARIGKVGKSIFLLGLGMTAAVGIWMAGRPVSPDYPITRVSVILPHNDDDYWSLIQEGIEEESEELGEEYHIDIKFYVPQLNYNIRQMTEILKQQVAAKVDVLVVQGSEDAGFLSILEEAREAGTEVICVDTPVRDRAYDLYVGTDNHAAGEMIGEGLAELTGGSAHAAVVSGSEGYANLEERLEGFREAVKLYPDIHIQSVSYDQYDGLTFMQLYHSLSEEADVIVCLEGTGGMTMSHTYTEKDDEYLFAVGFDAYEGVVSGALDGIVLQDTNQMGRRVVQEIAAYVKNGAYSEREIYTDILWVTRENYDEVVKE